MQWHLGWGDRVRAGSLKPQRAKARWPLAVTAAVPCAEHGGRHGGGGGRHSRRRRRRPRREAAPRHRSGLRRCGAAVRPRRLPAVSGACLPRRSAHLTPCHDPSLWTGLSDTALLGCPGLGAHPGLGCRPVAMRILAGRGGGGSTVLESSAASGPKSGGVTQGCHATPRVRWVCAPPSVAGQHALTCNRTAQLITAVLQ